MDLLLIGVVTKAHGLRGEVVVEPHHAGSPLWTKRGLALHALTRDIADLANDRLDARPERSLVMHACRPQIAGGATRYLCTFEGVADRDAAEALRGLHLAVEPAVLPPPDADEFYHHELRGFAVIDPTGAALGRVVGVFAAPAQDLLEVAPTAPADADTFFVPFVEPIVAAIDRAARTITIDPPEGLVP
jgi:16S rRNA processing protein RimM